MNNIEQQISEQQISEQQISEQQNSIEEQKKKKVKAIKIAVGIICAIAVGIVSLEIVTKVLFPNTTNSLIESLEFDIECYLGIELDINKDGRIGHDIGHDIGYETTYKPVIYIYNNNGQARAELTINNGAMTAEYPKHDELVDNKYIWKVNTTPDGTIITENGNEYSYIFWEAENYEPYEFKDGFCVKGEDTEEFLKSSLKSLNLLPREYNEFIVYWLPQMQNNKYNIIRFYGINPSDTTDPYLNLKPLEVYDNNNQLITNQLRVLMVWYSSDKPVDLEEQKLEKFAIVRNNATPTVIEWGGEQINR